MIIGLIGYSGAGKDTVAKMIQIHFMCKKYNLQREIVNELFEKYIIKNQPLPSGESVWQIKKFAYKLKEIVSILTGCKVNDLEDESFKNSPLPNDWQTITNEEFLNNPDWATSEKRTYRWMLQKLGTEAVRNNIHNDTWVNALFADYKAGDEVVDHPKGGVSFYPNWIITDVRFRNEFDSIKYRGGIILRVNRSSLDLTLDKYNHESEKQFLKFEYDNLITNDFDFYKLFRQVQLIMDKLLDRQ